MELCSGGSVADRILADGACSERDAARMVRALLEALAYAHDLGVVHRDVKIDNCLLVFNSPESPIKLVDWGYAAFLEPGGKLHKLCGTCYYLAPEVLAGCYDEKADVWSAGVTLYALLAGRLPFQGGSQAEVMQAIRSEETGLPDMTGEPWAGVGEAAKAAVAAMLTRDPARRPSAREMLAHPWLAAEGGGATAAAAAAEPELLHRIEAFSQMERLKQHAALYIARHLPSDQIRGLAVLFESLHAAGRTVIDAAALREALAARGGAALPGDGELSALLDAADLHGLGGLDLAEFLAAALHSSRLGEEANMLAAFKHFVRNGDGVITAPELAAALAEGSPGCAQPPSLEEAAAIIAAVDGDGDGTVDWKEFKRMMRADHPIGACAAAARISLDRHSSCGYYDLY
ncbi:calcium-dependent kinase [Raphidocelis subcapitata]|uniref:Calcium-dependent kinase n=1 Tax=Raphidocelis subcapitata TaxID=307507 RepID=A0A2V0PBL1_9CHLO|nr:calcium-dependent kinase [Raphidocelis subcapitata]|eukprot:GBF97248.1 calcium-dependent kinase [Raphidocelis subcapitata]